MILIWLIKCKCPDGASKFIYCKRASKWNEYDHTIMSYLVPWYIHANEIDNDLVIN